MGKTNQKTPFPTSSLSSQLILTPPPKSESSSPGVPSAISHEAQVTATAPTQPPIIMDATTAVLIRELLQQQAHEAANKGKGKQPSRGPSDIEVVLESLDQRIRNQEQLEADLAMARSLEQAMQDDGDIIARIQQEEAMARADRQFALHLAGIGGATVMRAPVPPHAGTSDPITSARAGSSGVASQAKAKSTNLKAPEETKPAMPAKEPVVAGPSNAARKRRLSSACAESSKIAERTQVCAAPRTTCDVCKESAESISMIQAPCSHYYCTPCLVQLVEIALAGEAHFPPRCCGKIIPLSLMRAHIGADLTRRHEEETIQREDPTRTLCSNTACAKYILPTWKTGNTGTCRVCGRQTCTLCRAEYHEGACQPEDKEVLEYAAKKKWQRCQCGHMVELNTGCHHITYVYVSIPESPY